MNRFHHLFTVFALCAIALAAFSQTAQAQTLFFDDFENDQAGLGVTSLTNWSVTSGSVDVIGPGIFDTYPGNGKYLDMDGSSGDAARIETNTAFNLTPGNYTLSFSQGKNGGGAEEMTISVGSAFSTLFGSPAGNVPDFVTREFNFTVGSATTGTIVFDHAGGDNQGIIMDNVRLARVATVVPEANTLALVLPAIGMVGTAAIARRRKK